MSAYPVKLTFTVTGVWRDAVLAAASDPQINGKIEYFASPGGVIGDGFYVTLDTPEVVFMFGEKTALALALREIDRRQGKSAVPSFAVIEPKPERLTWSES